MPEAQNFPSARVPDTGLLLHSPGSCGTSGGGRRFMLGVYEVVKEHAMGVARSGDAQQGVAMLWSVLTSAHGFDLLIYDKQFAASKKSSERLVTLIDETMAYLMDEVERLR